MFAKLAGTAVLLWLGAVSWVILSRVSADALAMGLGVALGIGAGVPVALLVLVAQRRSGPAQGQTPPAQQPPVIVIAPPHHGGELPAYDPYGGRQGHAPALPDGRRWIDGPRQEQRPPARLTTWQDAELDEWDTEEW